MGMLFLWSVNLLKGETQIDIRGLESTSNGEILEMLAGRLVYVREKPASAWRANDAAYMVEQILRNDGYPEVEVSGKMISSDRILLSVKEGIRRSLGTVEIETEGETETLVKLFKTPFQKRSMMNQGDIPYREDHVAEGLDFVLSQLKSEGYWKAQVILTSNEADPETGKMNIKLKVLRGTRFKMATPVVDSPDGRGVKRSATTWESFVGKWATTETINQLKAAMVEAFISRGYPDAEIIMTSRLGDELYYTNFRIELGTRVKLLEVKTEGLEKTKPDRIEKIAQPLIGEWYDEAGMNQTVRDLLATGAFSSVRVETEEVANKRISATLHFEEAKAREIALSAGAGSFDGPLFRSMYTDRNFMGELRALTAGFEINARGVLGEVKLADPWWRENTSRELRLYAMNKSYEGYATLESGVESRWKWDFNEHFSLVSLLGYSFVNTESEGLPLAFLGETEYSHVRMGLIPAWDYRDNAVIPTKGWHLSFPTQLGMAIGEESHGYLKLGIDGAWYYPINKIYQYGIGGSLQWIIPSGDIQDIPIDLRVFNGGSRSVRSFPERELGPSFGGDPYGGSISWAIQNEFSRPLVGPLRLVSFIDAGGLSGNYTGLLDGGLEVAAGLGLRVNSPIGQIRLEYGHNMTEDRGEPDGTWHFAIGTTF
ncbi:MAG: BamA/TamA family outer membrane protein [Verrucomicrobiota bacterium]